MEPDASAFLTVAFVVVVGTAVVALLVGVARAAGMRSALVVGLVLAAWCGITAGLATAGIASRWELRPPPVAGMLLVGMALAVWLARSRVGEALATRLPVAALVGFAAFRLPLELVMARATAEGVMPEQMSMHGWNFDVVTGATAAVLAIALRVRPRGARPLVGAWNVLGLVLLAAIGIIAVASTPLFTAFGDEPPVVNTWIGYAPFVWLPTVLVPLALACHLVVFRSLVRTPGPPGDAE